MLCIPVDANQLFDFLQEITEKIAVSSESTNSEFFASFLPRLKELMRSYLQQGFGDPSVAMRNLILRTLQKMCSRSLLFTQLNEVQEVLLDVAEGDTEDNALLALRIFKDTLSKNSRMNDSTTRRMEDFVLNRFDTSEFKRRFNLLFPPDDAIQNFAKKSPRFESEAHKVRETVLSKDSLKVISEIYNMTLAVLSIQVTRHRDSTPRLYSFMVNDVSLMPSEVMKEKYKNRFIDYLQVLNKIYLIIGEAIKSLSSESQKAFGNNLVESSIMYLKNCPTDCGHLRKEFLPVLRTLTGFYVDFYCLYLDELLTREFIVGDPNEWPEVRGEASSLLLNLILSKKDKLNDHQKEKVITALFAIVNDVGISVSIQVGAITAINKYIDIISKMPQHVWFCVICRKKYSWPSSTF